MLPSLRFHIALLILLVFLSALAHAQQNVLTVTREFVIDTKSGDVAGALSAIDFSGEGPASHLAFTLTGGNLWFGFTGNLRLEGSPELIPDGLPSQESPNARTIELRRQLVLTPGQPYQAVLSHNATSGITSISLIDLKDDTVIYESQFYLNPSNQILTANDLVGSGIDIVKQSVSSTLDRAGVPQPLNQARLTVDGDLKLDVLPIRVNHDEALQVGLSDISPSATMMPGWLRLTATDTVQTSSTSEIEIWSSHPVNDAEIAIAPFSIPPGQYRLDFTYEEDDYIHAISTLDLSVIAAHVVATLEIQDQDDATAPLAANISFLADRDVQDVKLHLIVEASEHSDTPVIAWSGHVSLAKDQLKRLEVTLDNVPAADPDHARELTYRFENSGAPFIDLTTEVYKRSTYYVSPHGNDSWSGLSAGREIGTTNGPLQSVSRAASLARPGDTVVIHTGVYRESVTIIRDETSDLPITFKAAPGARVILTGADVIPGVVWTKEEGSRAIYSTLRHQIPIDEYFFNPHPSDGFHEIIGLPTQVFVQGYPLRRVLNREQMSHGTFFIDPDTTRLYVWSADNRDVSKHDIVEVSTRNSIWHTTGDHIHVKGLTFRYAANRAQFPAVSVTGSFNVLEDVVIEKTDGTGLKISGPHNTVRRAVIQDHGQLGFAGGGAHHLHVVDSVVRNNNTKGYDRQFEAGGFKLVFTRNAVMERNIVVDNRGPGIWFDISNFDNVIRNSYIANNDDAGIFYEISFGLHAHDNVIIGNGLADTPGAWGADAGISISSSPGSIIERNLIIGNKEGIAFREQRRSTPLTDYPDGFPIWNHDEIVRNNILAYNRDIQLAGWFDVNDDRHWPAMVDAAHTDVDLAERPTDDTAARWLDTSSDGHPVNISLKDLNFTVENNLYAVWPYQTIMRWGVPWRFHRNFPSVETIQSELGFEHGSLIEELSFADDAALDLRIPADSAVWALGNYPQGLIPGVTMGVIEQK